VLPLVCEMMCDARTQKELGDRKSPSIDFVRQLLPLPKMFCEVIMSEYVHGGSNDTRGGSSMHKANNDADQRKQVCNKSCCFVLCFFSDCVKLIILHSFIISIYAILSFGVCVDCF